MKTDPAVDTRISADPDRTGKKIPTRKAAVIGKPTTYILTEPKMHPWGMLTKKLWHTLLVQAKKIKSILIIHPGFL
jgi:hypothetical protein